MDSFIKGREPGANITIMNTMYRREQDPKDGKYRDILTLVYKDYDTGLKYKEEIVNPDYEYFMIHPDKRASYPRLFVPKADVDPVKVPYQNLEKDIAKRVGMTEFFYDNISSGNRSENRKLHLHPDIFNSDMNIEDHYRFRFSKLFQNNPGAITKAFFDIETDGINMVGDFPEPGECPINAISLILLEQQQVFQFLLRTKSNPQIAEYEAGVKSGEVIKELEQFVVDAVGGPAMAEKYNIHFKYNFLFYDEEDEINLIKDLFAAINHYQPDFAMAWNMSFDIPYIIARIQRLGYDPAEIMSHPDFKYKCARYYVDERMKNEFAERGDFANIASYTTYLDQMIHFASRRKNGTKYLAFSLDFIGEAVAKVKKLDYKHITTNIVELPYKNFKIFSFYNIMDTIVQHCIEMATGDIDYVFFKSTINNVRYSKTHRQTVYLMNRGIKEFDKTGEGFVMGNNVNKFNTKPDSKFPGAFVADPRQLNNYSRLRIYGRAVDVFANLVDFDYSSLYPSIIREMNIAPHTQIGMLIIAGKVHEKENKRKLDNWTRASAFMEDFQSQVWLEINSRWFHLADYTQLYNEIIEFFNTKMNAIYGLRTYTMDGLIDPMIPYHAKLVEDPMIFEDKRREIQDIYVAPDFKKWEEWRNATVANPNQQF